MIKIIAVGKKHEAWVREGIERYQQRLRAPFNVEWVLLPHSTHGADRARQEESEAILSKLTAQDTVLLLDERGIMIDSPALSSQLDAALSRSAQIVLVIGGAYGVSNQLRARASTVWSLSPLVFAHQLVRLLVIEQLYRAQEINRGGKYHHE